MITNFQEKCINTIKNKSRNGSMTLQEIARCTKSNQVAVYSAMMSLMSKNLAGYFRSSPDRWGVQMWWIDDDKIKNMGTDNDTK